MPWTVRLEEIDGIRVSGQVICPSEILPLEDEAFSIIGYIDPDNDTIFTSVQMIPFLKEWSRLESRASELGHADVWRGIVDLANRCKDDIDIYLRFVGG
jgi:hypothetical protein